MTALEPLDEGLWVARRPLRLAVGDIGARMTVVRLANGELWLHSPVALDDETRVGLDAVGTVRWVVGPSRVHHFYLSDYASAYPDAVLCAAPGLPEKKRDVHFAHVLGDGPGPWGDEIQTLLFRGAPSLSEIVCFHPATRTLILTDLVFNVTPTGRNRAKLFHWLVGATGRFGPHRLVRAFIRDRVAARRSFDEILGWDFDRIVMSHGEVLPSGGRERLTAAFEFLP